MLLLTYQQLQKLLKHMTLFKVKRKILFILIIEGKKRQINVY